MDRRKHLTKEQVDEVIELFNSGYGARRISVVTGIPEKTLVSLLNGTYYTRLTGGRIMNGRRPEAVWRGGPRSFSELAGR